MLFLVKQIVIISVLFSILGCSNSNNLSPTILYKTDDALQQKKDKSSAVVDYSMMVLDENKKKELIEESLTEHRIKPNDSIKIIVYGLPELSSSIVPLNKTIVSRDGTIQLSKIGILKVSGMTLRELRKLIIDKLKKTILNPDVTVSIIETDKKRYTLLGEFAVTKTVEQEEPLTLMELIAAANGIKRDNADLRHAYIARNNKKLPINLYRLIDDGDLSQNIQMRDRDIVVIPRLKGQFAYFYSRATVGGKSPIPIPDEGLTLTQALAVSGLTIDNEMYFNLEELYIVRTEPDRIETFVVDANKMFTGEALPFEILPGDVIYLPKTHIGNINTALQYLTQFLNTSGSILTDLNLFRNVVKPSF